MASLAIDTLWYSDKGKAEIGKTDTLGTVSSFFSSYDTAIRDLAWDGTNLWAINLDGVIRKFSPAGSLLNTYSGLFGDGWGLTFDGAYIWASDPMGDALYKISFPGLADTSPPPAPTLASSTHSAEGTWYPNDSPLLTWTEPADPSGINGYSYSIDHAPATVPDAVSEGAVRSKSYTGLAEGTWYFHCRARDGAGNWGPADHYQIRIDKTAPPAPLGVTVVPSGWSTNDQFTVRWTNPPDSSTIAGVLYKRGSPPVQNNDGTFVPQVSELDFAMPTEGQQNIYLWLRDGAGNSNHNNRSMVTLRYDGSGPYEGTISINNGEPYTMSGLVTLDDLGALDYLSGFGQGALMRFSNNGALWCPPELYAGVRPNWNLALYGGNGNPGKKTVFVQYQDLAGNWSLPFSDTIIWAGSLSITTGPLPGGTVGFAYQETLTVAGGVAPYTWYRVSGSLPHNIFLNSNGILHGTPDRSGTFTFAVEVADSFLITDTKQFTISIATGSMRGDVDNNTVLDLFDALLTLRYILGQVEFTDSQRWAADATGDGIINISDAIAIINLILGRPPVPPRVTISSTVFSLVEDATPAEGMSRWTLSIDSPARIAGLQIRMNLPPGSKLSERPQLSEAWSGHSLMFSESEDHLQAIVCSMTGDDAPSSPGPIFSFALTTEGACGRDNTPVMSELLAADENGYLLPVEMKTQRMQTDMPPADLARNYPNPFNASTRISYTIPVPSIQAAGEGEGTLHFGRYTENVTLKIFNVLGQQMRTLVDTPQEPGLYTAIWDGRDEQGRSLPSGVYFCRIEGPQFAQTFQLALLR